MLKNPAVVSLLVFFTYAVELGRPSIPLTGDQKTYLSIAVEMFEKKEWIIPTLFGSPNFLKPPFQYWATLVGWHIFGISLFGALLPSVLALAVGTLIVYAIGKKINLSQPALASLLFASTFGSMTYGSTAQMEIWIVLFFLSAWWAVLNERLLIAYILVGVMAWVKGPLYPALWTIGFIYWRPRSIQQRRFWLSLILGVTIGLAWYLLAASTHRNEILGQFFYTENMGKMATHQGSMLGLWSEFTFSLFPWVVLFVLGCFQKTTRQKWRLNRHFYLSYALFPMVFFTFFPYRVNSYFYLLTPILAMLTSETELKFSVRGKTLGFMIYLIVFLLLSVILGRLIQGGWIGANLGIWSGCIFIAFLMGYYREKWTHVALASLALITLIRFSAVELGTRDVAGLMDYEKTHSAPLAYYLDSQDIWHEFGLISAILGHPVQRIYNKNDLDTFLAQQGSVIFQEDQQSDYQKGLQCKRWPRLKRKMRFPLARLFKEGIEWGDPSLMRECKICSLGRD